MKKAFSLFVVFAFAMVCLLFPAGAQAAMPQIQADRQYFDVAKGIYVLSNNVVIVHKNRRVTAGEAKTNLVEVWAGGGITFQQDDLQMNGSSLYANFPRGIIQVLGGVEFCRDGLSIYADHAEFNWKTKLAVFAGDVRVQQGGSVTTHNTITYHVVRNEFL